MAGSTAGWRVVGGRANGRRRCAGRGDCPRFPQSVPAHWSLSPDAARLRQHEAAPHPQTVEHVRLVRAGRGRSGRGERGKFDQRGPLRSLQVSPRPAIETVPACLRGAPSRRRVVGPPLPRMEARSHPVSDLFDLMVSLGSRGRLLRLPHGQQRRRRGRPTLARSVRSPARQSGPSSRSSTGNQSSYTSRPTGSAVRSRLRGGGGSNSRTSMLAVLRRPHLPRHSFYQSVRPGVRARGAGPPSPKSQIQFSGGAGQ